MVLLVTTGLNFKIYSQNSNEPNTTQTYITARYHYGIAVPHHTSMTYLINDFSRGVELTYGRSSLGKDNWEKYFNYPEIGIGAYYGTFGNKEIYGSGFAVYPYCNFNIYRSRTVTFQYKVSLGVGYATKPFKIDENIYNAVFGSHFNAYVGFGLLFDYRFSKRFSAATSFSLNHLSNGGMVKPNAGINTSTISIGTKYHFNSNYIQPPHKPEIPKSDEKEILLVGFMGASQGSSFTPNKYWSWGFSASHLWHNTIKRSFGVGFDLMYYGGAPYLYLKPNDTQTFSFSDSFYGGIFLAYNKMMGRTTMFFNLGTYLFYGVKPIQPLYPRLGIRYAVTKNLQAHFGIKANFFTAEYLEFGLGYRIPYNKK